MNVRTALVLVALLASMAGGCAGASGGQGDARSHPHNDAPREGIGAGGDRGATTRDMPGRGRGSEPIKGAGVNH